MNWRPYLIALAVTLSLCAAAQTATPLKPDPFASLSFLLGTWNATTGPGTAGAKVIGTYTFRPDLAGAVLIRTGSADQCKGPAAFDCQHQDALTIYHDMAIPPCMPSTSTMKATPSITTSPHRMPAR